MNCKGCNIDLVVGEDVFCSLCLKALESYEKRMQEIYREEQEYNFYIKDVENDT